MAAEEVTTTTQDPTTTTLDPTTSSASDPTGSSVEQTVTSGQTGSSTSTGPSTTGDSSVTTVEPSSSVSSQSASEQAAAFGLVCEEGWTLSDSMCFKIVETAVAFATAETGCSGLAEDAMMAAPKSAAIMTTLNALNPSGEDVWVGLDDRYKVLFL